MQLQDFYDYKNQLMHDLLTNENIVHLLDDSIQLEDAGQLAYKQVFPFEYVPETIQEADTYICFDVDVLESLERPLLLPILYIWVFSHKSKLRLPEGGVRPDAICSEICKEINGSYNYCLGELNLYSAKRFAPLTDYNGKCLSFRGKEVSRFNDPGRPIPANRKNG